MIYCHKKIVDMIIKSMLPFLNTRLMPPTSPTDVPSTDNQSIDGWGLPDAEQSNQPPDEFENSSRDGGSITKLGPRRCESYISETTYSNTKQKKKTEINKFIAKCSFFPSYNYKSFFFMLIKCISFCYNYSE